MTEKQIKNMLQAMRSMLPREEVVTDHRLNQLDTILSEMIDGGSVTIAFMSSDIFDVAKETDVDPKKITPEIIAEIHESWSDHAQGEWWEHIDMQLSDLIET